MSIVTCGWIRYIRFSRNIVYMITQRLGFPPCERRCLGERYSVGYILIIPYCDPVQQAIKRLNSIKPVLHSCSNIFIQVPQPLYKVDQIMGT